MKTTNWFPSSVKPVRIGVYQRNIRMDYSYSLWDGEEWMAYWGTPEFAAKSKIPSMHQYDSGAYWEWRGLSEKAD